MWMVWILGCRGVYGKYVSLCGVLCHEFVYRKWVVALQFSRVFKTILSVS